MMGLELIPAPLRQQYCFDGTVNVACLPLSQPHLLRNLPRMLWGLEGMSMKIGAALKISPLVGRRVQSAAVRAGRGAAGWPETWSQRSMPDRYRPGSPPADSLRY